VETRVHHQRGDCPRLSDHGHGGRPRRHCSPVGEPLRAALARWEDAIANALIQMGVPAARGQRLSTLMLSTLEGAIMMARVHDSVRSLTTVE